MKKSPVPQLRFHKRTGQHYVWHNKKRVHMGADPALAEARYKRWVADLVVGDEPKPRKATPANPTAERTVAEVLLAYYRFAKVEDAHNAKTVNRIWQAIEAVRGMYPDLGVSQFRGPQLKSLRADLVANRTVIRNGVVTDEPINRTYVNYLIACVQRCWKWALRGSGAGRRRGQAARPRQGRTRTQACVAAGSWLDALAQLPPVLSAMVQVQTLGGMRPQDVCRMNRCEISTSPAEKVELAGTGRMLPAFVESM